VRRMRITGMLLALACALTVSSAAPVAAADPFEINVILSLTGPGSFLGKNEASAVALVEQNINKAGGIEDARSSSSSPTINRARRSTCSWRTR